jgi:MFS transporter, ACS family, solute carrier family 17 (sodium-dependent inorganic phosphate cotransporter), other
VEEANFGVSLETPEAVLAEGRRIVYLCCFVGVISSLDRQAMSVAIVPMSTDLGYSDTIKGSISSIFSLGYTIALLPLGVAQQMASARLIMAGGVIAWSTFTLLTPTFAEHGVSELLAVRMFVGAAEAVTVPTVQTFVARWMPLERRSSALALLSCAFQVGTITALLTAPKIVETMGWEAVFYSFGVLGFGWVAVWLGVARDYPQLPSFPLSTPLSLDSTSLAAAAITAPSIGVGDGGAVNGFDGTVDALKELPWKEALGSKAVWAAAAAHSASNWGLYVSLAWLPTFFVQSYNMDLGQSAMYSLLPYIAGVVSSYGAGVAADTVLENGMPLATLRRMFQGVGSLGPAVCMAILALNVQAGGVEGDVVATLPAQAAAGLFVGSVSLGGFSAGGFASSLLDISKTYSGFLYGITTVIYTFVCIDVCVCVCICVCVCLRVCGHLLFVQGLGGLLQA